MKPKKMTYATWIYIRTRIEVDDSAMRKFMQEREFAKPIVKMKEEYMKSLNQERVKKRKPTASKVTPQNPQKKSKSSPVTAKNNQTTKLPTRSASTKSVNGNGKESRRSKKVTDEGSGQPPDVISKQ